MSTSFVVIIPSYNNARWCRRNLESVLTQAYPAFRVVYIDDASTDETHALVSEYVAASPMSSRVTILRNQTRVGAVANIDRAVRSSDPSEVAVLVDGDDFLAHRQVLSRLNAVYQDPDVWATWGQFAPFPQGGEGFCSAIPADVVSANAYRDYAFVSSHLRTFYAGLYQRIRPADLQDRDGRFFTTGGDVAAMFALLEMAGSRARFLPEVLYRYNRENPINDDKIDRGAQVRAEMKIRGMARYGRVGSRVGTDSPSEFCFGAGIGRSLFWSAGEQAHVDGRRRPFRQLRAVLNRLGYTVRESQTLADIDDPHTVAVFDVRANELERLSRYPSSRLGLVLWEDPVTAPLNFDTAHHAPFGRIYTWHDDLVDNVRYFKLHVPALRPMIPMTTPFANRKFGVLVAPRRTDEGRGEPTGNASAIARYFADADGDAFDVFGWGTSPVVIPNFRGPLLDAVDRLRRYRFSFCCENVTTWNGYISWKIFDSFAAGCIPVYEGAPNVADWIPADCFINRKDFGSDAELRTFLWDMSEDAHAAYLDRIRAFLASEDAVPFTPEYFIRLFVDLAGGRANPPRPAVKTEGCAA